MQENKRFWSRIGHWLTGAPPDRLPLARTAVQLQPSDRVEVKRSFFLRPFARRDAAIAGLQQGFGSLAELMSSIRDNLEKQSRRQDEMISYLSHLPDLLHSLPEAQRMNSEALKAIGAQLQQHIHHQGRLAEIMDRVAQSNDGQNLILNGMTGRVDAVLEHNDRIASNLRQVSTAMQGMGRNSQDSVQVLQHIGENIRQRDQEMEDILQRQNSRLTSLLLVAMGCSVFAMIAVIVVGFLLLHR